MSLRFGLAMVLAASLATLPQAQSRDAAGVLSDMRRALGGDSALDAIRTVALAGTSQKLFDGRGRANDLEVLSILPDHYLEIRRDNSVSGPIDTRITYFDGFARDATIRRTDANIPFPPPPGPNTPEAAAQRARQTALNARQTFARMALLLFGRSFEGYPLDFTYMGVGQDGGRIHDVVDARAADGYTLRLAVDQQTHLPAVVSWMGPAVSVMTTSSTVAMRNGEVVSRQEDPFAPMPPPPAGQIVYTLVVSDYKVQDGLNWPRTLVMTAGVIREEIRIRRVRLNPRIDPDRFNIR